MFQIESDEQSAAVSHERFSIQATLLPSYIPLRVAEKILFVGESVLMFEMEKDGVQYKHRGMHWSLVEGVVA